MRQLFKKAFAPLLVASVLSIAPSLAATTVTPFACSTNDDFGFAGFGFANGVLSLNATVPADVQSLAGAYITAPGQAYTGFQFSILGGCQSFEDDDFPNPFIYVTGDDSFGDATTSLYLCDAPTSFRTSRNWVSLYFTPGAAIDGDVPAILNTVVIALNGDEFSRSMSITGFRVNGRPAGLNLHGLQGCSALDGIE